MMSSYGIFPTTNQMAPLIDDSGLAKPLTLKIDEPASISVRVSGFPRPTIKWQVGRKRVKESPKFHMVTDGDRTHTLDISRVTRDLEQGIWVVATNAYGEDCCLLEIRTYEIVLRPRQSAREQQSVQRSSSFNRGGSLQRFGSLSNWSVPMKRGASILSLKDWKEEMAIRNKMRSVDDLAFTSDKASLTSGLGYSLSVDLGDSDDPDLDEQFHSLSRHRRRRPKPVTSTTLVFPEVEPDRLVPCPNSSKKNASRSELQSFENKNSTYPEQIGNDGARQILKQNQKKRKKQSKTSTSVPDSSTVETTQDEAELMAPDAQNFSDMPGSRWTNDEDVWRLCGNKLAEMCRKMLESFPQSKTQTLDFKKIPILETFEERKIVDKNAKDSNGSIRPIQSSANDEGLGMQRAAKHEGNEDNDEMMKANYKVKSSQMLINEANIEMTAVSAGNFLKELSNSGDVLRKSHYLSLPLNHETEQQEPVSDSDVALLKTFRKSSSKKRNKRKSNSEFKREVRQERTVHVTQDNSTEATNNGRIEGQLDENYNKVSVCKVSVGGTTKKRSKKKKKRGKQRSFEIAANGTHIQTKMKTSKIAQSRARTSGRVEHKASTPEENEAVRTFVEKEAIFAVRTFAEIEARTSEKVKGKARTSRKVTEASTPMQAERETGSSIENEVRLASQTENQNGKNDIRTHDKVRKTSEKVKCLGKPEQNKTFIDNEFSPFPANALLGSCNRKKSFSSELIANANDSVDTGVLAVQENNENCRDSFASADIEYASRVNTKPVAKKKIKKQKTRSKVKVVLKSNANDNKKCKKLTVREDLRNRADLEDSEVLSEEEPIILMDREPRSGTRRPGETNKAVDADREINWAKSEESLERTSSILNEANTSGQIENKAKISVEKEAREEEEEESEEQIILMDREPRGGTVHSSGNKELLSRVQTTEEKRSAGLVSSQNLINFHSSPRQNNQPSANFDQSTNQQITKGKMCANEDSTEIVPKDVQRQDSISELCAACSVRKSLYRNDLSALKAEELAERRTSDLPTDNSNLGINFSQVSKPELKYFPPKIINMEKTFMKETCHETDASAKPAGQLVNMESQIENPKYMKKSGKKNSDTAVESTRFAECNREFSQSPNSFGRLSCVRNDREILAPNSEHEMKASSRPSFNSSTQLKTEPKNLEPRDPDSERETKTPSLLKSWPDQSPFEKNPEIRAQHFENNVQASNNSTIDVARYRLPQPASSVERNNAEDQEKTESTMTSEDALILKALAERIRSGQVEIIIVNKNVIEEDKKCLASGNLASILNASNAREKVNAAETPFLIKTEKTSKSAKSDAIRFIDSDDSAEILETSERISKLTDNLRTVSNEKHIDSSGTKLNLHAATAQLPGTKVDLPGTWVDIPGTKVDLPGSKVDVPDTNLDLSETNINVNTNRLESKMKESQNSATLDGIKTVLEDIVLPRSPYIRRDIASNRISERNSALATMLDVNKTRESNTKTNILVSRTQPSGKPELEYNQSETVTEALLQSMSDPAETRKPYSVEVELVKLNPPKPKPRDTISYSKRQIVQEDSTKQSMSGSTIPPQTQHKVADLGLNGGGFDEINRQPWHVKQQPGPKTILPTQHKPANFELNVAKDLNGVNRLTPQMQPQPAPRTKLPTKTNKAPVQLTNQLASDLSVLEVSCHDKSSLNQQVSSEGSDLDTYPTIEATAKKTSTVREILVKWNETSTKARSLTEKNSSSATQVPTVYSKNSSTSPLTTVPVEMSSTTTRIARFPIGKSYSATQVSTVPVEKPSTESHITTVLTEKSSTVSQLTSFPVEKSSTTTELTPVPEKNSSISHLTTTVPTSNIGLGQNTTSGNALKCLPTMSDPFAKTISPVVTTVDRTTFALNHHYPPFRRYVSAPQYSSEKVYRRKFGPDYMGETINLRHQTPALQNGRRESSNADHESSQINTTARTWAWNRGQLCDSTVNTPVDLFHGNRDIVNDQESVQQNRCSKQQEILEESENGQNVVDDNEEISTLLATQSELPSRSSHFFTDSNKTSEPNAETNDAGLRNEQPVSSISFCVVKNRDSSNSARTEEAVLEGKFATCNSNEKGTAHYQWSTKTNKGEYVSTVVTHEYGELITLYPAT